MLDLVKLGIELQYSRTRLAAI